MPKAFEVLERLDKIIEGYEQELTQDEEWLTLLESYVRPPRDAKYLD